VADIAGTVQDGLLALAVGTGLQVMAATAIMEESVIALAAPGWSCALDVHLVHITNAMLTS
jgi:hypothetical protein